MKSYKKKSSAFFFLTLALFLVLLLTACDKKDNSSDKITIKTAPTNLIVKEGDKATLIVEAESEKDLTYQWYKTLDNVNKNSDDIQEIGSGIFIPPSNEDGKKIEGATSKELVLDTNETGVYSYYVEVKNDTKIISTSAVTTAVVANNQGSGSELNILFACGGNTGRSPMSEVIAKDVFAKRGITATIDSAGTDIDPDGLAPEENALILMKERGLDLSEHEAKMWTSKMLENADVILVASESHKNRINVATLGIYSNKVFTMREYVGDSGSVEDAFEKPMADYIIAADMITDIVNRMALRIEAKEPINSIKTSSRTISLSANDQKHAVTTYLIGDQSYLKIDDLLTVLNGTDYEFSYELNDEKLLITKTATHKTNSDKKVEQTEESNDVFATPVNIQAFMDNTSHVASTYDINSEYYYRISDFGKILGFEVLDDNTENINLK